MAIDPSAGEPERRAYRMTVERLLDRALQLRRALASDTGASQVGELEQRVRELGQRAARQRTALLDRDEAAIAPLEERLRHVGNIMRECEALLAARPPEAGPDPR